MWAARMPGLWAAVIETNSKTMKTILGVQIMKKILISLLVALVLLVAGNGVNAEGKGGGQDKKAKDVLEKAKSEAPAAKEKTAENAKEALEKARAEAAAAKAKAAEKAKEAKAKADKAKAEQEKVEKAKTEEAKAVAQNKAKGKAAEQGKPEEKGKPADKGKAKMEEKAKSAEKALGKEHQQQLAALRKQVTHEGQKHLQRKVRLERIRQLAADAGKTETVARVDKLIAKEQQRYDGKLKTMTASEQKILQAAGSIEEAAAKGKAKADQAKGKADKAGEGDEAKDKAEKAAEEAKKAKGEAKKAGGE